MTDTAPKRVMPAKVELGKQVMSTMGTPMFQREAAAKNPHEENPNDRPTIMGYVIPTWQRPLVWTQDQMISFIESAWKGLPLGTYTFNRSYANGQVFDNLLIDGQQRMYAIQCYLEDQFKVFGYYWSETTDVDKRFFECNTSFPSYITETDDEQALRDYYNMMNFGGTNHTEDQRA